MAMNFASKFSDKVDEKFTAASFATQVVGNAYDFDGVDTVNIYSVPTVPMQDYSRHASDNRYGTSTDLMPAVQSMKITKDRSFTFVIDRGDLIQSQMVMECNRALSRQMDEVVIPEYDTFVFSKLAEYASAYGNVSTATPSKQNAYELLLGAQEWFGNHNVPEQGRIAICSYNFANLLLQDPAFVRYGDASQQMLQTGQIGEVDGVKIMRVPSSRLPSGASCILTHPFATVAPKQLNEYKIHDNPPRISGYLVEGRFIYDCFVLNNKADGIYYIGNSGIISVLDVQSAPAVTAGKTTLTLFTPKETGYEYYVKTGSSRTPLTYGTAVTLTGWTKLTGVSADITATGDKYAEFLKVDAQNKPIAYGICAVNIG